MDKPQVEIMSIPPNAISRDLCKKFNDDLEALIKRSVNIMMLAIGAELCKEIVLSCLANTGVTFERAAGFPPTTLEAFLEIIRAQNAKNESV
jgi:hypothetical protein